MTPPHPRRGRIRRALADVVLIALVVALIAGFWVVTP